MTQTLTKTIVRSSEDWHDFQADQNIYWPVLTPRHYPCLVLLPEALFSDPIFVYPEDFLE